MRILYSHRIQSHDGQGVHVEAMVAALRAAGHEVRVVGPGFYRAAAFGGESRAVAFIRHLLPGMAGELAELAYNLPAYTRLRRACREFRPALIYERYNLYFLAGALVSRHLAVPFYVEVNAPLATERARFGNLHLHRLARWAERFVWRSALHVLTVTGVLRDLVAQAGVPPARITVTPNGIDPERFLDLPMCQNAPLVLGFVGFMRAWHGLDQVIAAMARDRDPGAPARVRLLIVGDGPVRPELERQVEALGLGEQVRFTGLVNPDAVPALVGSFDIALQPKAVAYASPLKIFEYMAAGRAIVAPDQPNIREILRDGTTALLFDPGQPDALWSAVRRLVDDPTLRADLGAAARRELTVREYTWAHNAGILTKLATTSELPR